MPVKLDVCNLEVLVESLCLCALFNLHEDTAGNCVEFLICELCNSLAVDVCVYFTLFHCDAEVVPVALLQESKFLFGDFELPTCNLAPLFAFLGDECVEPDGSAILTLALYVNREVEVVEIVACCNATLNLLVAVLDYEVALCPNGSKVFFSSVSERGNHDRFAVLHGGFMGADACGGDISAQNLVDPCPPV